MLNIPSALGLSALRGASFGRPVLLWLQVVPERELTLQELAQHDGSDPDRPLMLAIRGTVFDITPGTSCPMTACGA